MDKLGWARPMAVGGLHVVVLEKCSSMADDRGRNVALGSTDKKRKVGVGPAERPPELTYVPLSPNCGRESHSFIWYIINHYDQLRPITVFMQGDAHYHLERFTQPRLAAIVSELHASPQPPAFLPLTGLPVPNTLWSGAKLPLHCELYRNFSGRSDACQLWTSTTHAHFAVSRAAIHRHSRRSYRTLLRQFEAADGTCRPRIEATVLLERSWSLIFGCTRWLGCPFTQSTDEKELFRACPKADGRINVKVDGSLDLSGFPAARHEPRGKYHEVLRALRSDRLRLPTLADGLENSPRWPNPASRSQLSGTCWTLDNTSALP